MRGASVVNGENLGNLAQSRRCECSIPHVVDREPIRRVGLLAGRRRFEPAGVRDGDRADRHRCRADRRSPSWCSAGPGSTWTCSARSNGWASRKWRKSDPESRRQLLDEVRPAGATGPSPTDPDDAAVDLPPPVIESAGELPHDATFVAGPDGVEPVEHVEAPEPVEDAEPVEAAEPVDERRAGRSRRAEPSASRRRRAPRRSMRPSRRRRAARVEPADAVDPPTSVDAVRSSDEPASDVPVDAADVDRSSRPTSGRRPDEAGAADGRRRATDGRRRRPTTASTTPVGRRSSRSMARCRPVGSKRGHLRLDEMIQRFRERAAAVKKRPLPPVAGEERQAFLEAVAARLPGLRDHRRRRSDDRGRHLHAACRSPATRPALTRSGRVALSDPAGRLLDCRVPMRMWLSW